MKKTITATLLAILCAFIFCACNDNKENDPMNNNEQETVTIESLEGEWVGFHEATKENEWDYRYHAKISNGSIIIEREESGINRDRIIWWYGSFSEMIDGTILSSGLRCEVLAEDNDRFIGSERLFSYLDESLSTLEIPTMSHQVGINGFICFTKQ